MSAELALQQELLRLLQADATLRTLLADHEYGGSPTLPAVYDHVPQVTASEDPTKFPHAVLGDDTAIEFDTDDVNGQEHTATLHVWDLYRGRKRVKQILDAIYDCLHEATLSVAGHHTVYCLWEYSGSVPEPHVLKQHAVTRFRIVTQGG